jgi:hypothetical protein
MRRYDKPHKTRRESEAEIMECLKEARRHFFHSSGPEQLAAMDHYLKILRQFTSLTVEGKVPREDPCYN